MKRNIALTTLGAFALVMVGLAAAGIFGVLAPSQPVLAKSCDMDAFIDSHINQFWSVDWNGGVWLTWGSLTESGCVRSGEVVERRADGETDWEVIAIGHSSSFVDNNPPSAAYADYRVYATKSGMESQMTELRHYFPNFVPEAMMPAVVEEDAIFCTYRMDGVIHMEWLPSCDMMALK